jgi:glutamyl-tRNA synthetase
LPASTVARWCSRIEDTDSHRFVPGAEEYILESFRWLGIKFDEGVSFGGSHGPYRQSERRDIYKSYVNQLLDAGKAYYAFDTPEELERKRAEVENFQYDASTRLQMRNSLTIGHAPNGSSSSSTACSTPCASRWSRDARFSSMT